ncbi:MAG: hypothetical protein JST51_03240 [Armatimonadetes bacterium]|nr:hypothetical protein [Armatimonadota bacterium]
MVGTYLAAFVLGNWGPSPTQGTQDKKEPVIKAENGFVRATFTSPKGPITVILPDDIQPGDTISGTVFPGSKDINIGDVQIDIGDVHGTVTDPGSPRRTWKIPEGITPRLSLSGWINGGETLGTTYVPVGPSTKKPDAYTIPSAARIGAPFVVKGPYDGEAANTTVFVGGQPIPIVAESPRQSVVIVPTLTETGPSKLVVEEGGQYAKGPIQLLRVDLSTPKSNLLRGEKSELKLHVEGLDGLQTKEAPMVVIENLTPSVIDLEGRPKHFVILKANAKGEFDRNFLITSILPGSFGVSAVVQPGTGTTAPPTSAIVRGEVFPTTSNPGAASTIKDLSDIPPPFLYANTPLRGGTYDGRFYDIADSTGKGPCEQNYAELFQLLHALQQQLDANKQATEDNPLVQEVRLYQMLARLLQNPPEMNEAIKNLLEGKFKDFYDSLQTKEGVAKTLDYMSKVIDFIVKYDKSLTDAQKAKLKGLSTRINYILSHNESFEDLKSKLEAAINEFKALVEDPLGFLEGKIKQGLEDELKKLVVKAVGEKAAGAIFSILSDLVNLSDFLQNQAEHDALQNKINELLQSIYDKSVADPCFRITTEWNERIKPYIWFKGPEWSGLRVKIKPVIYCYDEKTKKYRICEDSGIQIVDEFGSNNELDTFVPKLGDGEIWKVDYKIDASQTTKCGQKCMVLIQITGGPNGDMWMWAGSLP